MEATSREFKSNARAAMADANLQRALGFMKSGFPERRREAVARLPEFDQLRDQARDIKDHTLAHLDFYLERFEAKVRRPKMRARSFSAFVKGSAPAPSPRASR